MSDNDLKDEDDEEDDEEEDDDNDDEKIKVMVAKRPRMMTITMVIGQSTRQKRVLAHLPLVSPLGVAVVAVSNCAICQSSETFIGLVLLSAAARREHIANSLGPTVSTPLFGEKPCQLVASPQALQMLLP